MNILEAVLTQPTLRALGWALLHFLWQGAGVCVLLAGVLALLRGKSSRVRYAAACCALVLMLVLPALTFWRMTESLPGAAQVEVDETAAPSRSATESWPAHSASARAVEQRAAAGTVAPFVSGRQQFTEQLEALLPWLILVWTLGVLALSTRMLGGLLYARRLKREGARPVVEYWQEKLKELSKSLRVTRPVRLLESSMVHVPTAVGWMRPVVLLPASALVGLTREQLEAVLAHELAHIRRHDYLINLLQTLTETLLFYHPAVWWVSRQVRLEREHVCDDLAVSVCGDALVYARALTKLERLRQGSGGGGRQLAMAADGGELRTRIRRLVETSQTPGRPSYLFIGTVFIGALLTSVACARAVLSQKQVDTTRAVAARATASTGRAISDGSQTQGRAENQSPSSEVASLIARDRTEGEDALVRRIATSALGGHEGSVVVMDPRTGRVYTIVNQEWALRRSWTPASTMKLVTSLAGIGEGVVNPSEKMRLSGEKMRLDLTDALAVSNNLYFQSLGERVGVERLLDYARRAGFGELTGINYEGETAGSLPSARARVNAGKLGSSGEGMEVTPIQLAALVSAIANGGTLVTPRVPLTPEDSARFETHARRPLDIPPATIMQIVPGMVAAVERGTAKGARGSAQVAGKTGSVMENDSGLGLFASYAPTDNPRFVVVVLTRGRDERGAVAASIAGTIYKALGSRP